MKNFKTQLLLGAAGTVMALTVSQPADATALVATIVGAYDNGCRAVACAGSPAGVTSYAENSSVTYDTPELYIFNPTNFDFTGATLSLMGYQADNNGATATTTIGTIAAHTLYRFAWVDGYGGTIAGDLFSYDYDDSEGNQVTSGPGRNSANPDSAGHYCGEPGSGAPTTICSYVGNFDVVFQATWDNGTSTPLAASFSPDPTRPFSNAAGTFVGWEGLDADGLSETVFDVHSGTFPGTLANIFTGTTGIQTHGAPEPTTVALFGTGLGALACARRRRRKVK